MDIKMTHAYRVSRILAGLLISLLVLYGCGGDNPPSKEMEKRPESFTFFNLGVNTALDGGIRSDLESQLGRAAVSEKDILDLNPDARFPLTPYFDQLRTFNRRLNPNPAVRNEHEITILQFRYPGEQNPSFKYVRLIFDGRTGRPLVFRIIATEAGSAIVDTLRQKYGAAQKVKDVSGDYDIFYWRSHGDLLVSMVHPDRYGKPEYNILIYYTANLESLILREEKARAAREQEEEKAGKKAF